MRRTNESKSTRTVVTTKSVCYSVPQYIVLSSVEMDIELESIKNDKSTDDNHSKTTNGNLTWRERIQSSFKITSISMTVLLVWLLCETLLCVIVLNYGTKNHIENFINHICDKDKCPTMLAELLFWRIVASSVAITGILTVKMLLFENRITNLN